MNLIVDIGNTLAKAAVVDQSKVVETHRAEQLEQLPLSTLVDRYAIERSILCTTRADAAPSRVYVESIVGHCLLFDSSVALPLEVEYSRSSLGHDRLAASLGASQLYPNRNLMVVDFGTAITIDFVSSDGVFRGGFISPGLTTRLRSLHDYTASLPLLSPKAPCQGIATSTQEAIIGGVMNGIIFEIEGYIEQYNQKKCELLVIFLGGDSIFFDKRIKNAIFADRDILFRGLDTILEYNV